MKAVTAGKLNHVSASQITTFQRCNRRWYFSKVLNAPEPEKPATALGERLHKQMEDWFEKGLVPTHDSARLAVESGLLPPRDPGIRIEHPRDYGLGLSIAGVPVRGRMDALIPGSTTGILDHKSTKSFRYCKTSDELRSDVQLSIYGEWAFQNLGCDYVQYTHNYLRTEVDNPGFKLVKTLEPIDRNFVQAVMAELVPTVEEMKVAAAVSSVEVLERNDAACWDYGGCPFREICPSAKVESFSDLEVKPEVKEKPMSLKAKLDAAHGVNPPDANTYEIQPSGTAVSATSAPVASAPTTTVAFTGLVLFVDCVPVGYSGPLQRLDQLIEPVQSEIAAKHKVSDVRMVKYAEGTSALVGHFRKNPPTGPVLASSAGLSGLVVEALEGQATLVVRGVR